MRRRGFTLIEVLVVVAIIAVLIAILVPSLTAVRRQVSEVVCRSNLRQVHLACETYGNAHKGEYFVAPMECNPHLDLINALKAKKTGTIDAMYCPRSDQMEAVAQNTTDYPPKGLATSVMDTPANRELGNIGYLYWSFKDRSPWRSPGKWTGDMDSFRPRALRQSGKPIPFQPTDSDKTPCEVQKGRPGEFWFVSGFWRKKAPFPHLRKHKSGVNVLYLDGHGDLMVGQPRARFK